MTSMDALLREIEAHLREFDVAESTFGRRAVNDGKLVDRLRRGGDVTLKTAERVRAFIASERAKATPKRRRAA